MSEQPTPETDKIAESLLYERADKRDYELRRHARRLERERSEALEELAKWQRMSIEADKRFVEAIRECDALQEQLNTAMMAIRLQQRREQQTNEQS